MDNRRLTFGSNRDGLQKIYVCQSTEAAAGAAVYRRRDDGAQSRELGASGCCALYEIEPARGRNVLVYRIGESIAPVAATGANERSPAVSRDGRWIAYVSDASGRDEVYVARLDRGRRGDAGDHRRARPNLYGDAKGCFTAKGRASFCARSRAESLARPRDLFDGHFERDPGANLAAYDVDPQGRFFIMLKSALQPRELRVVQNWGTECSRFEVPVRVPVQIRLSTFAFAYFDHLSVFSNIPRARDPGGGR